MRNGEDVVVSMGNTTLSLESAIGNLPDELKLRLFHGYNLRVLARLATTSRFFKSNYEMIFNEALTRGDDTRARQYLFGLEDFAKTIKSLNPQTDNTVQNKLKLLFDGFYKAYTMAKDIKLKAVITASCTNALKEVASLFNDETLRVKYCLQGFQLEMETLDVAPYVVGSPISKRSLLLDRLETLLNDTKKEENQKSIIDAAKSALQQFIGNPAKSACNADRKLYLDNMNIYQRKWSIKQPKQAMSNAKKSGGCSIS